MNRKEFMNRLEQLLQGIPEEDRKDALRYYEDYFEDAGPEWEQDVIRKLGSPEDVAQSIWEDVQQAQWNQNQGDYSYSSEKADNSYESNTSGQYNYNKGTSDYNCGTNEGRYDYNNQNTGTDYTNQEKKEYNWVLIIALIVTAPITIPIIFSILGTFFGFFMGMIGVIIGMVAGAIGLLIGAFSLLAVGVTGLGLLCLGLAFGFLCIACLVIPLVGWVGGTVIPSAFRWIKNMAKKLLQKGGCNL